MTRAEREQMREICRWNSTLARENARLRDELRRTKRTCLELRRADADLRVKRAACDYLLRLTMGWSL
jgi:hypothetical protein